MASERVTALSAPLVSAAGAAGTPAIGWSTRAAVIETMWPEPCFSISAEARCVMWKKPATLTVRLWS